MITMASATVKNIFFQDKIPVISTTCLELETYIKGHHVYKAIWTPRLEEQLNIRMEPDSHVAKFTVCVENDQAVVGHLKKKDPGKTIFYFLKSDTYSSCYAKVSWKRCNLKDGQRLQVPCKMVVTGQKNM